MQFYTATYIRNSDWSDLVITCTVTTINQAMNETNMLQMRHKYFDVDVSSLRNLFQSVDNQNNIDFIKETHFYNLL